VRTPKHNFGPARLAGGVTVTPLARRLAARQGSIFHACAAPARTAGSSRTTSRPLRRRAQQSAALTQGPSAAEIMALYGAGTVLRKYRSTACATHHRGAT